MLTLDWKVIFTFVNLIVLFLLLRKFLFRPVTKILEEREALIKSSITSAQEKEQESVLLLEQAQQTVSTAAQEAERVAERRMEQARREQEQLLATAQAESERVIENGKKQTELERQKLLSGARAEVVTLAMAAARKIAGSNPSTEQADGLFRDLLDKVGDEHE